MKKALTEILSAVALTCALPLLAVELPTPLAWFDMKDVSDGLVRDASGNGCDLTLGAGVSVVEDYQVGLALSADGTTAAWATFSCPAVTNTTIAFWIRRDAEDGSILVNGKEMNTMPYVLSVGYSGIGINYTRNTLGLAILDQQNSPQTNFTGTSPTREEWHHVAVVIEYADDGAFGKLTCRTYQDGVLKATTSQTNNKAMRGQSAQNVTLLNTAKGGNRPTAGLYADFRFYDEALSAAQVRQIAIEKMPHRLVMRYAFDETLAATDSDGRAQVAEMTGNGSPLTLLADTTLIDDGVDGKAAHFMGTTVVGAFTQTPDITLHERTFAVWLRPSSLCTNMNAQVANAYPRLFDGLGGMAQFGDYASRSRLVQFMPPGQGNTRAVWSTTALPEIDTWSHLAIIERLQDDGSCRAEMYANGEWFATSASTYDLLSTDGSKTFILGNSQKTGGNRYYCGDMDDFRLYSYALSADEIRRLARGLAAVEAGADFTVAGAKGTLLGRIAANAGDDYRKGYAGEVAWSLVSAPDGATATILNPAVAETEISLSGTGTYVFRLSVSDLGVTRSDDVTVTCVAADASNAAPSVSVLADASAITLPDAATLTATVSDDDKPAPAAVRVRWSKKSGPGGVWFEPDDATVSRASFGAAGTYVLTCTADDGQATAAADVTVTVADRTDGLALSDGLLRYWSLDGQADPYFPEAVTGAKTLTAPNYTTLRYVRGKVGNGVRASAYSGDGAYFSAGIPVGEVGQTQDANGTAYTKNQPPVNDYLTISAWIYIDPEDENLKADAVRGASIVGQSHTLGLRYNEMLTLSGTAANTDGFSLFQQGLGGSSASNLDGACWYLVHWPAPTVSPVGRWMHICAVLARNQSNHSLWEMWYDGVKQTSTATYGTETRGRVNSNPLLIAGMNYTTAVSGGYYNSNWPKGDAGEIYTRTFPGIVDEVRIWSRKLTAAEIRYLAANPIIDANRGPSVETPATANASPLRKTPTDIACAAFADVLPEGSSLTYEWTVVSDNAALASFGDSTAAETTFTAQKKGAYVLQLKVSDGERTVWSQPLTVNVKAAGLALVIR